MLMAAVDCDRSPPKHRTRGQVTRPIREGDAAVMRAAARRPATVSTGGRQQGSMSIADAEAPLLAPSAEVSRGLRFAKAARLFRKAYFILSCRFHALSGSASRCGSLAHQFGGWYWRYFVAAGAGKSW